MKFEVEGREFVNILSSIEQFLQTVKVEEKLSCTYIFEGGTKLKIENNPPFSAKIVEQTLLYNADC
jgi:hypothetical protein